MKTLSGAGEKAKVQGEKAFPYRETVALIEGERPSIYYLKVILRFALINTPPRLNAQVLLKMRLELPLTTFRLGPSIRVQYAKFAGRAA